MGKGLYFGIFFLFCTLSFLISFWAASTVSVSWDTRTHCEKKYQKHTRALTHRKLSDLFEESLHFSRIAIESMERDLYRQSNILQHYLALIQRSQEEQGTQSHSAPTRTHLPHVSTAAFYHQDDEDF